MRFSRTLWTAAYKLDGKPRGKREPVQQRTVFGRTKNPCVGGWIPPLSTAACTWLHGPTLPPLGELPRAACYNGREVSLARHAPLTG
jgi:hypothetical protein